MEKKLSDYRFYKGQEKGPYPKDSHQNYFWRIERQYHEAKRETATFEEYIEDWCNILSNKAMHPMGYYLNIYNTIEP